DSVLAFFSRRIVRYWKDAQASDKTIHRLALVIVEDAADIQVRSLLSVLQIIREQLATDVDRSRYLRPDTGHLANPQVELSWYLSLRYRSIDDDAHIVFARFSWILIGFFPGGKNRQRC